jgi:hypothetical protein
MKILNREAQFDAIEPAVRTRIFTLARDSVRTSLEIINNLEILKMVESSREFSLTTAIRASRDNLLAGARSSMQRYHVDYTKFLRDIRGHALNKYHSISGPLVISFRPKQRERMFELSPIQRFVDGALRSNALCMPFGDQWTPCLQPLRLECPPIFVWDQNDPAWTWKDARELEIDINEDNVMKGGYNVLTPPSIFITYRMQHRESINFRTLLANAITGHPRLPDGTIVLDGSVHAGAQWANEIRRRLRISRAVVGDVTGLRPDVCFELGFARGLNLPIIPVVIGASNANLPEWISAIQNVSLSSEEDTDRIISGIIAHLSDPNINIRNRLAHPVPERTLVQDSIFCELSG